MLKPGNRLPPLTIWMLPNGHYHMMPVSNISYFDLDTEGVLEIHTTNGGKIRPVKDNKEPWAPEDVAGFWFSIGGGEYIDDGDDDVGEIELEDAISDILIPEDSIWAEEEYWMDE